MTNGLAILGGYVQLIVLVGVIVFFISRRAEDVEKHEGR